MALDHVRALAAFMVVAWHFGHAADPRSLGTAPALAFLDEGYTGVALFMVLSGYLFAKLLEGSRVLFLPFVWNRLLRLAPLLGIVIALHGIVNYRTGGDPLDYFRTTALGFLFPPLLQKGLWSIAAELQFYLFLPALLWLTRRWTPGMLMIVAAAVLLRYGLYLNIPDFQTIVFRTIIGRCDQFVFGMLAFHYSRLVTGRVALLALSTFLVGFAAFDLAGGFYRLPHQLTAVWIVLPTFEAICFGALIAWYDRHPITFRPMSRSLELAGTYSYSIYLLHFFFFVEIANFIDAHIMAMTTFYRALPWTVLFFVMMTALGHLTYRFIEAPFLRYRRPYLRNVSSGDRSPGVRAAMAWIGGKLAAPGSRPIAAED